MPSTLTSILVERLYSQDEFDQIIAGVIPESMEDKWFVFYESPWLHLHRSWTGLCCFKVRFESGRQGVRIAEALVNRGANQAVATADEQDAAFLITLLDSCLSRNLRRHRLESMRSQTHRTEPLL